MAKSKSNLDPLEKYMVGVDSAIQDLLGHIQVATGKVPECIHADLRRFELRLVDWQLASQLKDDDMSQVEEQFNSLRPSSSARHIKNYYFELARIEKLQEKQNQLVSCSVSFDDINRTGTP